MRERAGTGPEIARQYRGQLLNKLFGELYCDDKPMSRSDRYDKLRIKQVATDYLQGAGVELARSGKYANAVERVLRDTSQEERHDIPGAVMAVVTSETMFRSSSVLSDDEKQELYIRADYALMQTDMTYRRGGWDRFNADSKQRSELILTHELNNLDVSSKTKQELLALYDQIFTNEQENNAEINRTQLSEKPSLARRFGRHLLRGLSSLAFMGGPVELGPEHRVDDDADNNDDGPDHK